VTIRISTATTDDLPEVVASVDALFATDAGAHNAAATNLRWASENGIAYYTPLLADSNNLVLLARDGNEVAGHLVGRISGPGSVHPIRVADLESVHVYPAHRNRGVGQQLATAFLAWAAEKGAAGHGNGVCRQRRRPALLRSPRLRRAVCHLGPRPAAHAIGHPLS
jgi:GNAT superfamily N-acetyltransferase